MVRPVVSKRAWDSAGLMLPEGVMRQDAGWSLVAK